MNACHCRDCQRLTGSAFAVNAMFNASEVKERGASWSDADRSGTPPGDRKWQCAECKVLLYADHPAFPDMRFVRVGTLDDGSQLQPDAHFLVRSKHRWVVIPSDVPAYETLPDRRVSSAGA
ncbi:GFA family protein [Bosea sp. PAMC 26642]|uniref:GFA family protein n=1 Tax=Bosea sp. (strain PAMC 26642) TaxID=1792307 RepID=UPI003FA4AF0B